MKGKTFVNSLNSFNLRPVSLRIFGCPAARQRYALPLAAPLESKVRATKQFSSTKQFSFSPVDG